LEPSQERIRELLLRARVLHMDETSLHLGGLVRWVHVNATKC